MRSPLPISRFLAASIATAVMAGQAIAGPSAGDGPLSYPQQEAPSIPEELTVDWEEVTLFGDIGETLGIAWKASYSQLLHADNLTVLGVGAAATWVADDNDDEWLAKLQSRDYLTTGFFDSIGDQAALALAAAPVVTWLVATWIEDEKLQRYSIETMSSIALSYAETMVITNAIPTHGRPRDEGSNPATNFFDTAFRGEYSFPAGHLIGPFTVTLKTLNYYGWKAALIPAGVTSVSTFNRIADGSHYPSDIVAAAVLALSAHVATRRETRERDGGLHWGASPVAGGGLMVTGRFDF